MQVGADDIRLNTFFAKRPARFQAINALDQNVAALALAHMDGLFFCPFHNLFGKPFDLLRIQRLAAFRRQVNFLDFQFNGLKQNGFPSLSDAPPHYTAPASNTMAKAARAG